jgi:hypothetical protein
MTEETRKELSEIIDRIADLARQRHSIRKQQQKIWDRTSVIRAKLTIDIATAKDDKGKPIYSNEQLREAALTLGLAEDEEFQGLKERLRALDDEEQALVIEHSRLMDQRTLLMLEMGLNLPSSDSMQQQMSAV